VSSGSRTDGFRPAPVRRADPDEGHNTSGMYYPILMFGGGGPYLYIRTNAGTVMAGGGVLRESDRGEANRKSRNAVPRRGDEGASGLNLTRL